MDEDKVFVEITEPDMGWIRTLVSSDPGFLVVSETPESWKEGTKTSSDFTTAPRACPERKLKVVASICAATACFLLYCITQTSYFMQCISRPCSAS
ncbi:MAG: hypothetical protein Q9203_000518 [Teloschistes exilis]